MKSKIDTNQLRIMYGKTHLTLREIAKVTGMSAQAVMKRLHKSGMNSKWGEWVWCHCDYCGKAIKKMRSVWRKTEKHYCNNECYYASLQNPDYYQSRNGTRIARVIVAQHFNLQPEHVVHHKDGDNLNNNRDNLQVFASHSVHIKATHHNNPNIKPIWDGAEVI